jgi:hypothetical protein
MNITQISMFTNIENKFRILKLSKIFNVGLRIDSELGALRFTVNGYDGNVAAFMRKMTKGA